MKVTKLIGVALAAVLASCVVTADSTDGPGGAPAKRGSGELATEVRDVGSFTRLQVTGSPSVAVTVGPATGVTVSCDDNLIADVLTYVEDETLHVELVRGNYRFRHGPKLEVTTPGLESVTLAGSSKVSVEGVRGPYLAVDIAGSGAMTGSGEVGLLEASIAGSGAVDLREIEAQEARVYVAGSGDVKLTATKAIDARVQGSGVVRYYGNPGRASTRVSGSGKISKR